MIAAAKDDFGLNEEFKKIIDEDNVKEMPLNKNLEAFDQFLSSVERRSPAVKKHMISLIDNGNTYIVGNSAYELFRKERFPEMNTDSNDIDIFKIYNCNETTIEWFFKGFDFTKIKSDEKEKTYTMLTYLYLTYKTYQFLRQFFLSLMNISDIRDNYSIYADMIKEKQKTKSIDKLFYTSGVFSNQLVYNSNKTKAKDYGQIYRIIHLFLNKLRFQKISNISKIKTLDEAIAVFNETKYLFDDFELGRTSDYFTMNKNLSNVRYSPSFFKSLKFIFNIDVNNYPLVLNFTFLTTKIKHHSSKKKPKKKYSNLRYYHQSLNFYGEDESSFNTINNSLNFVFEKGNVYNNFRSPTFDEMFESLKKTTVLSKEEYKNVHEKMTQDEFKELFDKINSLHVSQLAVSTQNIYQVGSSFDKSLTFLQNINHSRINHKKVLINLLLLYQNPTHLIFNVQKHVMQRNKNYDILEKSLKKLNKYLQRENIDEVYRIYKLFDLFHYAEIYGYINYAKMFDKIMNQKSKYIIKKSIVQLLVAIKNGSFSTQKHYSDILSDLKKYNVL